MIFEQIDAGGDRNFSYLIGDEESRLCAVVDPGYDTSKLEARVKDLTMPIEFSLENMNYFIDWTKNAPFEVIRGEGECAV